MDSRKAVDLKHFLQESNPLISVLKGFKIDVDSPELSDF